MFNHPLMKDRCKMNTIMSKMTCDHLDEQGLKEAGEILRQGGTVAFPTETVYGLGANALDPQAIHKIYEAKGRPSDNPLIVHIGQRQQVEDIGAQITDTAKKLMDAFWPGPLTVIVNKKDSVPKDVSAGLPTVGIRLPAHPIALALLKEAGVPVAAPSANTSGKPSPTIASHVIEDLSGRVNMIIDGGNAEVGVESTVIDASTEHAVILRPGAITLNMCKDVLGEDKVSIDPGILDKPTEDLKPKSPGMKYTHYSPKAKVFITRGTDSEKLEAIKDYMDTHPQYKVGVMATKELLELLKPQHSIHMGHRHEPEYMAAHLFKALREFDEQKVDIILAEEISYEDIGFAVMNRLLKAAGFQYLQNKDGMR